MKFTAAFIPLLLAALPAFAGYIANAQVGVSGGSANAYYNPCGAGPCLGDPLFISASSELTAITLGPVRSGFIEVTGFGALGGPAGASGSIGSYFFSCSESNCGPFGGVPTPFTLGVPFDIDVSADAQAMMAGSGYLLGAADIQFQFYLFENNNGAPGASVAVYDASSIVPEPGTFALVGTALLLAVFAWRKRDRTIR